MSLIPAFSKPLMIRSLFLLSLEWTSSSQWAWIGLTVTMWRSGFILLSSVPWSSSFLISEAYHLVKHSFISHLKGSLKVRSSGCNSPVQPAGTKTYLMWCLLRVSDSDVQQKHQSIKYRQSSVGLWQFKGLSHHLNVRCNDFINVMNHSFFCASVIFGMPYIPASWEIYRRVAFGSFPCIQ